MVLRIVCVCLALSFLVGCGGGELRNRETPPLKVKDTAYGAVRRSIFIEGVEKWD